MNTKKTVMAALGLVASLAMSGATQAALHDRGGGLIYDDVLNVTWLRDASYGAGSPYDNGGSATDGRMYWNNAAALVTNLTYHDSVRNITYDDWRLPKTMYYSGYITSELQSLYQRLLGELPQSGGLNVLATNHNSDYDLFVNIQPTFYWLSDPTNSYDRAWYINMYNGTQNTNSTTEALAVWAVRDGDVAAIPEADTWAMLLAGLGLIGAIARHKHKGLNGGIYKASV